MEKNNIDSLLILKSQVILGLQLAVIPLIHFVSDKQTMGSFKIKPVVKFTAWLITAS